MERWELEAKRKKCLCGEPLEPFAENKHSIIKHCLNCGRLLIISKICAGIMWYKPEA